MSPTCQCLINPNWAWNNSWGNTINSADIKAAKPPALLNTEKAVVSSLVDSWNKFLALGHHTTDDLNEYRDAIHRCQQIIALRVARRADPDIWRQPEE